MTEYETLLASILIKPSGCKLYSKEATRISIDDKGGGLFVTVEQEEHKIGIDVAEWPHIRDGIERMLAICDESHRDDVGKLNLKCGGSISFASDNQEKFFGIEDRDQSFDLKNLAVKG